MTKPIRWGEGHVGHQTPGAGHGGNFLALDNCAFCTRAIDEHLRDRGFCDPCRDSLQPDTHWVERPARKPAPPQTAADPPLRLEDYAFAMGMWWSTQLDDE